MVTGLTRHTASTNNRHSLTFHVRRYVVIATKPVHRLQIRQQCTARGHPYHSPNLHPGQCSSVQMQRGTQRHIDHHGGYKFHLGYASNEKVDGFENSRLLCCIAT